MLRLLASLVALSASFSAAAGTKTLVVYLDKPLLAAEASFQHELNSLLEDTGYTPVLRAQGQVRAGESADKLMVVRLRGACSASELPPASNGALGPLASTVVEGNRILPFAELFCDRTLSLLSASIAGEPLPRRNMLFGRALARQFAHEIFHFLTQDKSHTNHGVSKACFRARDLLAETFEFDPPATARISVAEAEEPSGR